MKALLPLALLMAAGVSTLVLAGCSTALPSLTQKEVVDSSTPSTNQRTVPAIDAGVPAETETATFALG